MLRIGERAVERMVERAQATGAMLHILFRPGLCEQRRLLPQAVDEAFDARIAKSVAVVGAEFRQQAARTVFPFVDQPPRRLFEKNVAQQIALMIAIEPA